MSDSESTSKSTSDMPMVNAIIDGKAVCVPKGTTVYKAAKAVGAEIPIFCYQDRMPPFGACRVCLVEVEKMAKPQTSCTLELTEGMVVKTQSAMAEQERKNILEFLLLNHPLDCPICDRAGECPLQDNVLKYGPGLSRFFEEKRTFKKPIPLGPVLMLDRERCIACARCTRFGDVLSGDHALEFKERGYKTEVGTPDNKPAKSKFIGNTIMICPVGALTSQVYRFRARPWDNTTTESTCTLCPVGCKLVLDTRDGEIMRVRSKENAQVNDIWLCDKGWFGYEFTSHPNRLKSPLIKRDGKLEPASWEEAYTLIAKKMKQYLPSEKIAAFGGNHLTFEENVLFQKLMREGAKSPNVDHRIGMPCLDPKEEGISAGMEMAIEECETLDYALFLGFDVTEQFPVIWLRLRQAMNKGAKVSFFGHYAPEVASHLAETVIHPPGQEIAIIKKHLSSLPVGKGALFVGEQYLNTPWRASILSALLKITSEHTGLSLNIMEGRGNSMGARLGGMHPDFGPFGVPVKNPGLSALEVILSAADKGWDFLYIAGANPALKFPSKIWSKAVEKTAFIVVQDLFMTETAEVADVVLPALSFVEKEGHFINIEGRVQSLHAGKEIPKDIYSDGRIFKEIAKRLSLDLCIDKETPSGRIPFSRPRHMEAKEHVEAKESVIEMKSGFLRATFSRTLFDQGVRMRHDAHLIELSEEPAVRISPKEGNRLKVQHGDIVNLTLGEDTIACKVALDPRVAEGTVVIPLGFEKTIAVHEFGSRLQNGVEVRVYGNAH